MLVCGSKACSRCRHLVSPETGVVFIAGKPRDEWVKLVERFPERFMVGSDVVGRFNKLGKELRSFDPFLDALPEDVARKVARDNFLSVLCGSKACPR